jgi:hypothetical protein
VPASRSRTEHWWDCLRKIQERGGAIEISVNRAAPGATPSASAEASGSDIVWRVKLLDLGDDQIVVEPPAAFGKFIDLREGVNLIGAITVGQNRWMFHTRTLGYRDERGPTGATVRCLVLSTPDGVERCSRRTFYRISTADLRLPEVQCWPLLDPATVIPAETANRVQIESLRAGEAPASAPSDHSDTTSLLLPDVGPMFKGHLVNVSGGGLGLRIDRSEGSAIERRSHFWLRVNLTPHIPAPLGVTARLAHTHIDSSQNIYAGMAFEFAFNPGHRKFVMDLFTGYVDQLVLQQLRTVTQAA